MSHEESLRQVSESHPFYRVSPEFRFLCGEPLARAGRQDEYEAAQRQEGLLENIISVSPPEFRRIVEDVRCEHGNQEIGK